MWKRLYLECSCENRKYLASIIDDLAIPCDEIIEETKAFKTNFDKKNRLQNTKCLYFSSIFINYYRIIDIW